MIGLLRKIFKNISMSEKYMRLNYRYKERIFIFSRTIIGLTVAEKVFNITEKLYIYMRQES